MGIYAPVAQWIERWFPKPRLAQVRFLPGVLMDVVGKWCCKCRGFKPLEEYHANNTRPDGRQGVCRECKKLYIRSHYSENKVYYKEKARARTRALVLKVQEIKSSLGCGRCGERHPACLHFHHRDSRHKEFSLARSASKSWERVLAEMLKCDLLCANCHAKHHFSENGNNWPPECDGLTRDPAKV